MIVLGDNMKISMKQAHHNDIEFLKNLRLVTMNGHLEKLGLPNDDNTNLKQIKHHFHAANILYIYDKPIGLLKFYQDDKTIHILQMQILPEYQGKKIEEGLLRELQEETKFTSKNIDTSVLKSDPMKDLYERLGFNVVSQNDNEFMMQYGSH